MEELFKDIIDQLVIINKFFKIKTLTKKDLKEETKNYDDFVSEIKELNILLISMQHTPITDIKQGCKNLVELHLLMGCVYWHTHNVHQRIMDVIKKYPTLNNNSYPIKNYNFLSDPTNKATQKNESLVEEAFKKVIDQLIVIDKSLGLKAFSKLILQKEAENYDSFVLIMQELRALLSTMQRSPVADLKQGSSNLIRLHTLMNNVQWYVNNVHNRVRDVIKEYPLPDDM